MHRRQVLAALGALPLSLATRAPAAQERHPLHPAWEAWKTAYLDPSGRVIDALQDGASHSEGQGYGMVLATALRDREAFEAMHGWTRDNLAIRDDALLAWRWLPDAETAVPDTNNASDGDLFYAWALSRGGRVFARPELSEEAGAVAADLVASCLVAHPGKDGVQLLLPGAFGFRKDEGIVVNPSYYFPRAMRELALNHGVGALGIAAEDGVEMLADMARTGPIPDWIQISADGIGAPEGFSSDSGYEALRVPLWMIWSGDADHPVVVRAHAADRLLPAGQSATVVKADGSAITETSSAPGYAAIASLAACAVEKAPGSSMPPFSTDQPYYPATLQMFTYLAQMEVLPECFPI
ncbi:glycosyl hydrolase family 5 [Maribius pontilimi]|uniref:cellulase n=1 Tax=Palleronia pontilimi TaxID=1964209 RepID=A0A934IIE5_9RHOB|nr:glycosyl hydrolase family 8 [Palleronia pontilimi]MBJ3763617.1 glycosyl hydrolase family 5 [Palleronia pontilimi]